MYQKLSSLSIVLALLLIGTGCGLAKNTSTPNTPAAPVAPKDCKTDLACGNALIANCNPGTFTTMDGRAQVTITIKNKSGNDCILENSLGVANLGGFGAQYDENKDGKISMECPIPSNVKSFSDISNFIKDPNNLAKCSGELKKLGDDMNKAE